MRVIKNCSVWIILIVFLCLLSTYGFSQNLSVGDLRPPAVPLITIDPYTSCWSPSNNLNDSPTKHWTGKNHSMNGYLQVDGKTYRFMGASEGKIETIAANGNGKGYEAIYTLHKPSDNWMLPNFDDSKWVKAKGAFGNDGTPSFNTPWFGNDIWVRREIDWDGKNLDKLIFQIKNDDTFEMFINGVLTFQSKQYSAEYINYAITPEIKKVLKKGKNTIATHCYNTGGPGFIDFGIFYKVNEKVLEEKAIQKSLKITATQSVYEFLCGKVNLKLTFTSPLLLDNLDILSRPASYVTYEITGTDGKDHHVKIYVDLTPEWCVNSTQQEVVWEKQQYNGLTFLKAGTKDQNIFGTKGDGVRIDWGYVYLSASSGTNKSFVINKANDVRTEFIQKGTIPAVDDKDFPRSAYTEMVALAMSDNLGTINNKPVTGHYTIAYDDINSVRFFDKDLKAWWRRDGKLSFEDMLVQAEKEYEKTIQDCNKWDEKVNQDALNSGGAEYAKVCNLVYRQTIAAHKLVAGLDNTPYFFSKENYSGGFICTVDVTYPSAPLFLLYNTTLLKGMMEPIFYYSESGKWTKPFPAHDIGLLSSGNRTNLWRRYAG